MLLGLNDAQKQVPHNTRIGLYGAREKRLETVITRQNLFWIGERYGTDISQKFRSTLTEAVAFGYTKKMLQEKLAEQFKDLGTKIAALLAGLGGAHRAEDSGVRQAGRVSQSWREVLPAGGRPR